VDPNGPPAPPQGDADAQLRPLSGAIARSADKPASPGPSAVRSADRELFDTARERRVPVRVHYPDASGTFPVVVFSHGLGGSRYGYGYLGRSWASNGYVVVHPTHHGSDLSLLRGEGLGPFRALRAAMHDPANWEARARDVAFLLDQLPQLEREIPPLAGRLDGARVGVAGHSFGAYTAALVAGARVIFPGEREPRQLGDARPRAFLCLSPPGFGDRGLAAGAFRTITRPLLEITGTEDRGSFNGEPYQWRVEPFRELPPGDKLLLVLGGADHMSFAGGTVQRPASEAQKALVEEATLAFWEAWLGGDPRALTLLQPASLERDGIAVQVEQR
jgi:predicted dienelactone hydrolase